MYSLLFPGQGSQVVGMGLEFYNNFSIVKKIFQEADDKLNFSLSKIILEGPEDQLQLTKNTQPAILTVSYSIFKTLKDEFNFDIKNCKYFAGHSLGEYSALVCSGSLEFSDAVYLLNERGRAMQESVPLGKGSMIAVLGLSLKELENRKFDMVFIDADKMNYKEYYEKSLELLNKSGLLIIDNVLWHGEVADEKKNDKFTINIREFNKFVSEDKRVEQIIIPLGDGMTVCRVL